MSSCLTNKLVLLGSFMLYSTNLLAADDLDGTWQSTCIDWDGFGQRYEQETLVFDGGSWENIERVFSDASCNTAIQSETITGTFTTPSDTDGEGRIPIDITMLSVSQVFHDERQVALLNAEGDYCNGKILEVNEPIDPLTCGDVDPEEFSLPLTVYELVQIQGDDLLMSDYETGEGESPETRPSGIDHEERLTRLSP